MGQLVRGRAQVTELTRRILSLQQWKIWFETLRSPWVRYSVLKSLEQGINRVSDALTSLVLVFALAPQLFAKLAVAQAFVAPLMILFAMPERVIYRDYDRWKETGVLSLVNNLRVLRYFGWLKVPAMMVLALLVSVLVPGRGAWIQDYSAAVWAFAVVVAPHISLADREFLRKALDQQVLNRLIIFQKVTLFGGTILFALLFPKRLDLLALAGLFSAGATAFLATRRARRTLIEMGASGSVVFGTGPRKFKEAIKEFFIGFSWYEHGAMVLQNWIHLMDLMFLGLLGTNAKMIGLYAAVSKLAKFGMALPLVLSRVFSIWIGRQFESGGREREEFELRRLSSWLFASSFLQAIVIIIIAPFIFDLLSQGRWSAEENRRMVGWLGWILGGGVLLSMTLLVSGWLVIRTNLSEVFLRVLLPWAGFAFVIYFFSVTLGGIDLAAMANLIVAIDFIALVWLFVRNQKD